MSKFFAPVALFLLVSGSNFLAAEAEPNNVLDQAREKYRAAQVDENPAAAAENPATPVPAATPTPVPTAAPVASQTSPEPSPCLADPDASAEIDPPVADPIVKKPFRFFSFQAIPGVPRRAAAAEVALGFGLTVSSVESIRFAQISLIGNIAKAGVNGYQGSLIFNKSGDLHGVQAIGFVNIAHDVEGVQLSGVANIAHDVQGVQAAGLINIAHKVKGVQLGLINISDDLDGIAIGLINYSKNGINEIPVWYGDNDFIYAGLQMGGKNVYVLLYGGEQRDDWFRYIDSATVGASLGVRGKLGPFYLQTDAGIKAAVYPSGSSWTWTYNDKDNVQQIGSLEKPAFIGFGNFRLVGGFTIWGPFSLFAGINADIDGGKFWSMPDRYKTSWNFFLPGKELSANLSWIFGISL